MHCIIHPGSDRLQNKVSYPRKQQGAIEPGLELATEGLKVHSTKHGLPCLQNPYKGDSKMQKQHLMDLRLALIKS